MRLRLMAIGVVSVLAVATYWLAYSWPVTVQYFPSYAVSYSKGLYQSFELEVVNETGHPVHFCATMYGWLPNSSFIEIGRGCGRGIKGFDPKPLREYAETWRGLRSVEPGVIVLLTYVNGTDARGNITLTRTAKGFTIQPDRVLRGENIKATIKVKGKAVGRGFPPEWPSGETAEGCFHDLSTPALYCYVWYLDMTYYNAQDVKVPTVAVRIISTPHIHYINSLTLYFQIDSTKDTFVHFGAGVAISRQGVAVDSFQDTYSLVFRRSRLGNMTWYTLSKTDGAGVYVIGFYGDVAVARFKEYGVVHAPGGIYVYETGYSADIYLIRPSVARMQREVLAMFQDRDPGPTDNYGYSQIFNRITGWRYVEKHGDLLVGVYPCDIAREINNILLPYIGIPLMVDVPVSPELMATIGPDIIISVAWAYVEAEIVRIYRSQVDIYARVYYPDARFESYGGYYWIPAIFVDLFVVPQ